MKLMGVQLLRFHIRDDMKEFSIENVRIVKPDCVVENGSIKVENGIITAIKERGSLSRSKGMDAGIAGICCRGL